MPEIVEIEAEDNLGSLNALRLSEEEEEEREEIVDSEEESDDDDDENGVAVILGLLEKPKNPEFLHRHFFPSKAGGAPAWLDPVNLPSGKSQLCDFCKEPLQFVLQVYAPLPEEESAFHRILYIFMCLSMSCLLRDQHEQWKRKPETSSRSVKVFRCQLPRGNPFYKSQPPKYDGMDKPSSDGVALCSWCGSWKGEKVCSSCRRVHYCSEKHQVLHWRLGHKVDCSRLTISSASSLSGKSRSRDHPLKSNRVACNTLWPEFEIVNEEECAFDVEVSDANNSTMPLVAADENDEAFNSLLNNFEGNEDRKSFASFQERIGKCPEQVLRYCREPKAIPLWPMASGRPSRTDIQRCNYCGGVRCFEFQILPQLLYYFGVKNEADSLDWATIVLYTCAASCGGSVSYKEELAWVQLPTSNV